MLLRLQSAHREDHVRHESPANLNYVVEHLPEDGYGPEPGTYTLPWSRREDESPRLLAEPLERFLELPGFVAAESTEWPGRRVAINTANVVSADPYWADSPHGLPTVEVRFFDGYPARVASFDGLVPDSRH